MKKILLLFALLLFIEITYAQAKPIVSNVTIDVNGNYRERVDIFTGRYYISKEGKSLPVMLTRSGKLYVITGISLKTGKPKRKYLTP